MPAVMLSLWRALA